MIARARQLVVEHPMLATGGAVALGAFVAFVRPRGRITGAIFGAIGAVAIHVVRDLAMRKVSGYAQHWIDEREREQRPVAGYHH